MVDFYKIEFNLHAKVKSFPQIFGGFTKIMNKLCYFRDFQETQTGLMTGLVDFIVKDAPFARSLPDTKYDEYFRSDGVRC